MTKYMRFISDNINTLEIQRIAKSLLSIYAIVVQNKEYRICEIEFYIRSNSHDDEYTHSDNNQKKIRHLQSGTYKAVLTKRYLQSG
jgi:hypothetical protein